MQASFKVLLTGARGQLGRCLQDIFPKQWDILAVDMADLDITEAAAINACVSGFKPDAIINAAAYTAVDKAQSESDLCYAVNVTGVRNLSCAAKKHNAKFIHISTDYVFDGNSAIPYAEDIQTDPQCVYGKTKLEGEIACMDANPASIIIRTAWVFSEYGHNFVKTMLNLGKTRDDISIVSDQIGCPTYAGDIAAAIIKLLQVQESENPPQGIYHFCGDQIVSWYEFAQAIFELARLTGDYPHTPHCHKIATLQYPTPAKRPAYSGLDCTKISKYKIEPSNWHRALTLILPILAKPCSENE